MKARLLFFCFGVLGLVLFFFFFGALRLVDRRLHAVYPGPRLFVSDRTRALHAEMFVADLHADSLCWDRDLLAQNRRGQVDLPKLRQGGVALQVFTVFTKIPRGLNYRQNSAHSDLMPLLALAGRWPKSALFSPKGRALYQAARAVQLVRDSRGGFLLVRTRRDLKLVSEQRRAGIRAVGMLLGLEGAHALEGTTANLDEMFAAGYRLIGLVHFFDNTFGGSAHGARRGGLTPEGRSLVRRMTEKGMLVDLAHASPQLIEDVLALKTGPVIASHTGLYGVCANSRNLSDRAARGIAGSGGVIGIGFWEKATCGRDIAAIVRSVRYAVDLVGVEHVGLGSDFDGAVRQPLDASRLPELSSALLQGGFSERQVALIMGGNVRRVLARTLP